MRVVEEGVRGQTWKEPVLSLFMIRNNRSVSSDVLRALCSYIIKITTRPRKFAKYQINNLYVKQSKESRWGPARWEFNPQTLTGWRAHTGLQKLPSYLQRITMHLHAHVY